MSIESRFAIPSQSGRQSFSLADSLSVYLSRYGSTVVAWGLMITYLATDGAFLGIGIHGR